MASIQQVRYDAPPAPGFMDYAAQFLSSYMGAKKEQKETKQKELMTLLPALAAQGQIKPGGGIEYGGVPGGIGITSRPEDTQDLYRQMQIKKAGLELGLPGYEPTEQYLQNTSMDEADKQLNRSFRFQTLVGSPKPEDQATADTIRKTRAKQIYDQMRTGYNKAVTTDTETSPQYEGALPTDQVFKDTDGKWKVKRAGKIYRIE